MTEIRQLNTKPTCCCSSQNYCDRKVGRTGWLYKCTAATASTTVQTYQCQYHSTSIPMPVLQYRHTGTSTTVQTYQCQYHSTSIAMPVLQYRRTGTSTTVQTYQCQYHSTSIAMPVLQYRHTGTSTTVQTYQCQLSTTHNCVVSRRHV